MTEPDPLDDRQERIRRAHELLNEPGAKAQGHDLLRELPGIAYATYVAALDRERDKVAFTETIADLTTEAGRLAGSTAGCPCCSPG